MRIGNLDRVVTIERPTHADDNAAGDPVAAASWSAFLENVFAGRRDLGGGEALSGGETVAISKAEYRMHHADGVTSAMRLVDGGVAHDILSVAEIGHRDGLVVTVAAEGKPVD